MRLSVDPKRRWAEVPRREDSDRVPQTIFDSAPIQTPAMRRPDDRTSGLNIYRLRGEYSFGRSQIVNAVVVPQQRVPRTRRLANRRTNDDLAGVIDWLGIIHLPQAV